MSKIIHDPAEGTYKPFQLASFPEAENLKDQKKRDLEKEFVPDQVGPREKEFVLGGFDFEYGRGYRRDEILKKTTDEMDAMIANAKARVSQIEKEAWDRGYQDGFQKGEGEGFQNVTTLMESLGSVVESLLHSRQEFYDSAEKEMLDLVIVVAEEIIRREVKEDRSVIADVIRKAVREITTKQKISIRINPADLESGRKLKEELVENIIAIEDVEFIGDPSVTKGGCVVETNIGALDATVENRLMTISRRFRREAGK